ncbi:uncharacterized protein LOC131284968 [Anopheles ziemanni]|uniref:uncharacterized protein LOC131262677 n=1 Tax=Anopheles coustani TaxID=139045 RepID=UPI002659C08F|nr:uncharacterized protein LOC131262677 [Anopheles coustani]XP_058169809.1 uncharacterized protein LOC131284968 [Anopheles ziemanni]
MGSHKDSLPSVGGTVVESPVCGRAGELLSNCFSNFTSPVAVEALQRVKIPDSLEEINQRCMIFTRGMECVRQYLKVCVNARQRKIIENEVYGAQQLYQYLCYDHSFQIEFLRHKGCFNLMHPEWDVCSNQFIHILKDEMARTGRQSMDVQYIQFCCARYSYESCVYRSARFICKPESAIFLRRIAKLLSTDRHFLNCDRIENALCSGAKPSMMHPVGVSVLFLSLTVLFILVVW